MGWWRQSPPPMETQDSGSPGSHTPPQSPSNLVDKPAVRTRDEQANAELKDFLTQLETESHQHSSGRTSRTDGSDLALDSPSISPNSLIPTTMSCRQAFDSAFYCQSMGGQFNNLYRYGKMRNCSENWSQFWFCMRTKSQPDDKRKAMIHEHYRQRAVKYKVGPSSEDIWKLRKEPIEGAFSEDPDATNDDQGIETDGELTRV
ncbi:MAG: hypothetical protein M1827_003453 [Pycnora praestabilis]|nr:MAG: hypothetical protein M1827_003453 [Pycnora praestabilis]